MVSDVIRALGRRWYVVVVGAILTAALTYGAYLVAPAQYNARALVLLLPSESAVGEGGNPFLTLSGLEQPAGILVAYFSSAPARDEVERQSRTAEYIVGIDDSTRGPVIAVDVTDVSPQKTLDTLRYITDRIPVELQALQREVSAPSDAVITSMPLTVDQKAEPSMGGTIRLMIAALAAGLVATCATAFAVDGLVMRRRLRRSLDDHEPREVGAPDGDPRDVRSDDVSDIDVDARQGGRVDLLDDDGRAGVWEEDEDGRLARTTGARRS